MTLRRLQTLQSENARLREELFGEKNRLIWLHSHCLALGLNDQSDSGKIEENIALSVMRLMEELAKEQELRRGQALVNGELSEQLAAAQLDAARYRWRLSYIKENINDNVAVRFALESTDAAIDDAMKGVGHE